MTLQSAANIPGAPVALVTTAETVAAVLPVNAQVPSASGGIILLGYVNVTAGTAATAVTVKVRQGSTTAGAQVGATDTYTLAAGASASIPFGQLFTGAPPYGNQFCVTVTQVAATGNGSVNDGALFLDVVSVTG